jgi:hypothetical protein
VPYQVDSKVLNCVCVCESVSEYCALIHNTKACGEIIRKWGEEPVVFAVIQQLVGPAAGLSEELILWMLNRVKC